MTFTWRTMALNDPRIQEVDCFPTLDEVLADMALLAFDEPDNKLVDWVTDDTLGVVVAVAIFGPEGVLQVTCADGRALRFEMPESYQSSK